MILLERRALWWGGQYEAQHHMTRFPDASTITRRIKDFYE
jgi:hypothetical protein